MFLACGSQVTFAKSMSFACLALRRDVLGGGSVFRLAWVYSTRAVAGSAFCHESIGNGPLGRLQMSRQQGITSSRCTNTTSYSSSLLPSSVTSFLSTKIGGNGSDEAFGPIERTPVPEEADEVCSSCVVSHIICSGGVDNIICITMRALICCHSCVLGLQLLVHANVRR